MPRFRDFFRQPHTRAKGRVGEERAVRFLRKKGYRIVARNISHAGAELDVVATDGETLCFVEIKARAGRGFGGPVAAVDRHKRQRLEKGARAYLARHPWEGPVRFDVVGVEMAGEGARGAAMFTLLKNAFQAGE
jgi:putative endonuclease